GETLLDAYCGVGTLGLSLVPERGQLLGIESWPPAVSDARHNASGQARFWQGEVEQVLQGEDLQADAIVLDPPRAGCAPEALEAMADYGASRIVYVSCDPATLSRDIARLNTLGYALRQVQPVDLFPQTFHIETVVRMSKVDK
ncbi:MAG TPA: hypothetical protein VK861_07450, partial [Bacteroidales bacterium]|nr:hypothetical protein [Bacteroidales bacterium]